VKRVVCFKNGESIPDNATYLKSENVPDYENAYWGPWEPYQTLNPFDWICGGRERSRKIVPMIKVHYYEVEE